MSDEGDEWEGIDVTVIAATAKAIRCDGGKKGSYWIPRSVIEEGEGLEVGHSGEIMIRKWFVEKEGLE